MHLRETFGISERRACRVLNQSRSSQRRVSTKVGKDAALVERMVALSRENPRYGYRRGYGRFSEGRAGRSTRSVSPEIVEGGGAQGPGPQGTQTEAFGLLREWLHEKTCRVHRPRLELRLRDGCHRRRSKIEGDAHRGRVWSGVPGAGDGALDHRQGRGRDPGSAVHRAGRARLHPRRPSVPSS